MLSGEYGNRKVTKAYLKSVSPGRFKLHSIDRRDDVNANRLHADLKNDARQSHVTFRKVMKRRTELCECSEHPRCVLRTRPDPDVEVLGRADVPMHSQGMRSDDEVFNGLGVELG